MIHIKKYQKKRGKTKSKGCIPPCARGQHKFFLKKNREIVTVLQKAYAAADAVQANEEI